MPTPFKPITFKNILKDTIKAINEKFSGESWKDFSDRNPMADIAMDYHADSYRAHIVELEKKQQEYSFVKGRLYRLKSDVHPYRVMFSPTALEVWMEWHHGKQKPTWEQLANDDDQVFMYVDKFKRPYVPGELRTLHRFLVGDKVCVVSPRALEFLEEALEDDDTAALL